MKTVLWRKYFSSLVLASALVLAACTSKEKQAAAFEQSADQKVLKMDFNGAIADYTKAIALLPNAELYHDRGLAKASIGDFKGGFADMSQAIALNPEGIDFYADRSEVERNLGQMTAALADLDKVIQLDPTSTMARMARGSLKQEVGDFAGALDDYDKLIASSSNGNPWVSLHRYLLLRRLGRDPGELATTGWKDEWPKAIASFLTGGLNEADFQALAAKADAQAISERQCIADYFAGEMHLLNHDLAGARKFFSRSAAAENTDAREYAFARAELARLDQTSPKL